MSLKHLKNYEKYLHSIKLFAQAIKIKIEWKTEPSDGVYVPTMRKIRIDPDLDEACTLATLLHELGHLVDDNSVDEKTSKVMHKSYKVIYTEVYDEKDVDTVYKAEVRAWNYGKAIAKILFIPTGKWYDRVAREALRLYRSLPKRGLK